MIKSSTIPQCEPRRIPERVLEVVCDVDTTFGLLTHDTLFLTCMYDYWSFVWLSKYCANRLNFGYVIQQYDEWKVRQ